MKRHLSCPWRVTNKKNTFCSFNDGDAHPYRRHAPWCRPVERKAARHFQAREAGFAPSVFLRRVSAPYDGGPLLRHVYGLTYGKNEHDAEELHIPQI